MQQISASQEQLNYLFQRPSMIYDTLQGGPSSRLNIFKSSGTVMRAYKDNNHRATQSLVTPLSRSPRAIAQAHQTSQIESEQQLDPLGTSYTNSLVQIAKSREQKLSERDVEKMKYKFLGTANTIDGSISSVQNKPREFMKNKLSRLAVNPSQNLFRSANQTRKEFNASSVDLPIPDPLGHKNNTSMITAVPSPHTTSHTPAHSPPPTAGQMRHLRRHKKVDYRHQLQVLLGEGLPASPTTPTADQQHSQQSVPYQSVYDDHLDPNQPSDPLVPSNTAQGHRHIPPLTGPVHRLNRQGSVPLSPDRRIVTSSNWVLHKSKYPYSVYANRLPRRLKIQVQDYNDFYAAAPRTGNRLWRVVVFVLLGLNRMNRAVSQRKEEILRKEREQKELEAKIAEERAKAAELEFRRQQAVRQAEANLKKLELASAEAVDENRLSDNPDLPAKGAGTAEPDRLESPKASQTQVLEGQLKSVTDRPTEPNALKRFLSVAGEGPRRNFEFPSIQKPEERYDADLEGYTPSISGVPTIAINKPISMSPHIPAEVDTVVPHSQAVEPQTQSAVPKLAQIVGSSMLYYAAHHNPGADTLSSQPDRGGGVGKETHSISQESRSGNNPVGPGTDHTAKLLRDSKLEIYREWDLAEVGHEARISRARDTTLADERYISPWMDIVEDLLDANSLTTVYEVGYYSFLGIDDLQDLPQIAYDGEDESERSAVRAFWRFYAKVTLDCDLDEHILDNLHFISEEYEHNFAFHSHAYYTPQDLNKKFFIKLYAPHFEIERKQKVPDQLKKLANLARSKIHTKKNHYFGSLGTENSENQDNQDT